MLKNFLIHESKFKKCVPSTFVFYSDIFFSFSIDISIFSEYFPQNLIVLFIWIRSLNFLSNILRVFRLKSVAYDWSCQRGVFFLFKYYVCRKKKRKQRGKLF